MRQTLFMIAVTAIGVAGAFTHGPAVAVAVYYFFAALRPQFMWDWALPAGITWSQYVALAAIAATAMSRLGQIGPQADSALRQGPAFRIFVAFAAWICLTYVTAQRQDVAWPWFLEYLKIFVMFRVGAAALRKVDHIWAVFVLVTVALIYIAYEINVLYLFEGRIDVYHRGYGGLDNNGAGLMIAMGVPLALYAWQGTTQRWRWLFVMATPPMLHAVMMTYSRGAMLALLLVSPLMVFRSHRRLPLAGVALVMAAMVPIMAGQEVRNRFFSIQQYEADGSANSRFDSWAAATRIANDYPLFGVGIRNSNLVSHLYGADVEGRTIHSQYLQILADSGYPALALYVSTFAVLFFGLWRIRRRLRSVPDGDRRVPAMVSGVECSLMIFAIGGLFLSLEVFELPYALVLLGCQLIAQQALTSSVGVVEPGSPAERPLLERVSRTALPTVRARGSMQNRTGL
ncbi:MAG: O-antigen ligase family protein [Acidobacteria bacterium]|nr:O-antigen ligase family protein [Acidobacteriota bacterium]